MLFLMISIFIPAGVYGYILLAIFIMITLVLSKLKPGYALRSMKPMIWMMVFLLIINCFALRTGTPLFHIGSFTIYSGAIKQTLYIVVRLMMMIVITTILTATTKTIRSDTGNRKAVETF